MNMSRRGLVVWFALGLAVPATAQVIDPARRIDWSTVGATIVARTTQCGATIAAYNGSAATINSAIAACPAGQFVNLAAGTFTLSSGIAISKSNVTLRGQGANSTFLVFTGSGACHGTPAAICLDGFDTNYKGSPSNVANWTAGYAKGTTVLTLSSTTNLAIGHPLTLDQLDDSTDSGNVFACTSASCATFGDGGSPRPGRGQQQIVTVAGISGTQVTVTPGLYMPNWRSGQTPQAWWPTSPIANSAVENISVNHASSGALTGFQFFNCNGCWIKGVRSIAAARSHVFIFQSNRCTVRDSYFYENQDHATTSYGIEAIPSSDSLIENNIFQAVTAPRVMTGSCAGCVIAYNYSINNRYTASNNWQQHSDFLHAAGNDMMLFEGNIGQGIYSDTFHGTHHFITVFRNRFSGYDLNGGTVTDSNTIPLRLDSFSRFYNVIGNVLGDVRRPHTVYETGGSQSIYNLGDGNGVADDPRVTQTMMRWGNYDTVTGIRFLNSEVPTTLPQFPATVPSSQALPASFYLTIRPTWWPPTKPWPAIGPDITGGDLASVGGHAYSIPALDCYRQMGGQSDGLGAVLSFNAATCYPVTASNVPAAPTAVRVVP